MINSELGRKEGAEGHMLVDGAEGDGGMGTTDRKIAGIVFFMEPSRVYRLVRTLISLKFHYCSVTMSTGPAPIGLLSSHSNEPNLCDAASVLL